MNNIWEQCTDCLRTELTEQEFNTWISPLMVEEDQSDLCLYAPNRFVAEWVMNKFQGRIEEIVEQHGAGGLRVVLQVRSPDAAPCRSGRSHRGSDTDHIHPLVAVANIKPAVHGAHERRPRLSRRSGHQGVINADHTFENFVEGNSNKVALAASKGVAESPGGQNNPLCIYGGVGLGKTHLMHAIGNHIRATQPYTNVVYLDSERFVTTMVNAMNVKAMPDFKRFYRAADVLLIDDIQFFGGKAASQEEFFHTHNALLEEGRQIIVTSDNYPKSINRLDERLRSRLCRGLTVMVEPPELETRAAILIKKAELCAVPLPTDVAMYIAQHLKGNVRELEGALKKVKAHAEVIRGGSITIGLVKDALRALFAEQDRLVTIDNIQRTVAEYFKIRMGDMLSKRRTRSIARPRQIAMSLAKELTSHSLPEIGDAFGGRDHTTVLHACRKIAQLRQESAVIEEDIRNLRRLLST